MNPDDLTKRSHSLRNFSPEEFIAAWEAAESVDQQAEVRRALRRIDGDRWYSVLDAAHRHLAHSDRKARAHVDEVDLYSDEFRRWIGVFGLVEDLNTFQELTGISRRD